MKRIWVIARHEFTRHVFRKRYMFSLLSMPFLFLMMGGLIALLTHFDRNDTPLGIVDPGRQIELDTPLPPETQDKSVAIERFDTEAAARAALENGDIQAYYLLPENLAENAAVQLVYYEEPGGNATGYFRELVLANLLRHLPPEQAARAMEGVLPTLVTPDNSRSFGPERLLDMVLPPLVSFVFLFVVIAAGNYFTAIVVEEKENRTVEFLITSVSSNVFMTGKIIGLIGVSALQTSAWLFFAITGVLIGLPIIGVELPATLSIEPTTLLFILVVFAPAYVMVLALLTAIGAAANEPAEGQAYAVLITLPMSMSFYLFGLILNSPNSPLSIALSMFPITAPTLLPIRWAVSAVPFWQIALTSGMLLLAALGGFWLAGRALDLGLLRFKRLKLRELFGRGGR